MKRVNIPETTAIGAGETVAAGFNPFRILRRYLYLIAAAAAVGAAIGYMVYTTRPPVFQASAKVLVQRRLPSMPFDSGLAAVMMSSALEQMLVTHAQIIQSQVVVDEAARDPALTDAQYPDDFGQRAAKIRGGLNVTRPRINNQIVPGLLEIVHTSELASEPEPAVRAIAHAYERYLLLAESKQIDEAAGLIEKARKALDKELAELQTGYNNFLINNQLLLRDSQGNVLSAQVEHHREAELKLLAMKERQREFAGKLATLKEAAAKGNTSPGALAFMIRRDGLVPEAALERAAGADQNGRGDVGARLVEMRFREMDLLERVGPDHPSVKTLREKMNMMAALAQQTPTAAAALPPKDPKAFVHEYLESLELDLSVLNDQITAADQNLKSKKDQLAKFAEVQLEERQRREAILNKKALFEATLKRLEELRFSKDDSSIRAQVISDPVLFDASRIVMWRFVVGGCAAGFAVGFVLGLLRELTMNCYRSPEEIRDDLGVQVLAQIPPMGSDAREHRTGRVANSVVTLTKARSRQAEGFRALRTSLYFLEKDSPHRVLQITSPLPSDGKTTVAVNLAVSIAQSGKSVLLIDGDLRKPKVSRVLGLDKGPGLADVLSGTAEWESCLVTLDQCPGLSILRAGKSVGNPSELLTKVGFPRLLDDVRDQFDYVILDSPPVLAVSDPGVIAPRVDGVLVVLRIKRNGKDMAQRSFSLLNTVKAPIIGAVVNTFSEDWSDLDYGYGQYVYGRGKYAMYAYNGYRQQSVEAS